MAGYYQQSGTPGWGTNQFQFGAPPLPNFQPQPSWGGTDFYRAHASTSDPYLFDYAWNRVREYGGAPAGGMGVGLHEARYWHRRAYGGLNEISLMQPHEIGHAAAYEAYRTWNYHSSIHEPLGGDIERQREALTALAVAEASHLLQYYSRADHYARLAASEAAAHTASYIFYQSRDGDYRSRSRYREESFDDPYAFDDALFSRGSRGRSRSGHRHRSRSRHGSFSGGIPLPGQAYSSSSGSYGSYGNHMPGHATPYPHGVPLPPGSAYDGMSMPMGISNPPYSAPLAMDVASSYQGSTLGVPVNYSRSRASSVTYPQQVYPQQVYPQQAYLQQAYSQPVYAPQAYGQPYMGSVMSSSSIGMPAGAGPIIIHKKHSKRHKRARSSGPEYHHSSSSRY